MVAERRARFERAETPRFSNGTRFEKLACKCFCFGGASRDRTDDLIVANDALSQLSYSPTRGTSILTVTALAQKGCCTAESSIAGLLADSRRVLLDQRGFAGFCGEIFGDVSGDGAGRHRVGAGEVHLSWSAAAGEVAVLRADHDLVGTRRDSRTSIDARSAAWLNDFRSRLAKDFKIAFAHAVLACLLRTELDVELDRRRHALALTQRVAEDGSVHVHVFVLAGSAGTAIGDFDGNGGVQVAHVLAVAGIPGGGDHGIDLGGVHLDDVRVLRAGIAVQTL